MYNTVQPFVNLTNANIEVFSRFVKSPEITNLTNATMGKFVELMEENMGKVARSRAYGEWLRATVDNYARFADEYSRSVFGLIARSEEFVSRQVEEGAKRLERITDAAGQAVEAGANAAKDVTEEGAKAAEDAAGEVDHIARARQHRGHGHK